MILQCIRSLANSIAPSMIKKGAYTTIGAHHVTYLLSQRHIHHTDTWVQSLLFRYPKRLRTCATWWWQLLQHKSCCDNEIIYSLITESGVCLFETARISLSFFFLDFEFYVFLRVPKCHIYFLNFSMFLHWYDILKSHKLFHFNYIIFILLTDAGMTNPREKPRYTG